VTAVLLLPVTVAENCWVCEIVSEAIAALTDTLTTELTLRLNCTELLPKALVAVTVKRALTAALGVPVRAPVDGFKASPGGSVPLLTPQVMGVVPEADRVCA
jgi:hypothetical protein